MLTASFSNGSSSKSTWSSKIIGSIPLIRPCLPVGCCSSGTCGLVKPKGIDMSEWSFDCLSVSSYIMCSLYWSFLMCDDTGTDSRNENSWKLWLRSFELLWMLCCDELSISRCSQPTRACLIWPTM